MGGGVNGGGVNGGGVNGGACSCESSFATGSPVTHQQFLWIVSHKRVTSDTSQDPGLNQNIDSNTY